MSDDEAESHSTSAYSRLLALAKGGMGEVEIALRQEGDFKRLYAVKRLLPHLRDDAEVRKMFLAEARIAGLIRHSNVVSVLDVGEDERGPFLVMDYIEGVPVTVAIKKHRQLGEPIPLQLVLRIIAEAARGLQAAHELYEPDGTPRPIVHRDISPQNILLGFDGVTRVTDFGVAKALGHLAQTDDGVLKGKIGYMSPEQLQFKALDGRSDLFSLAVVLYELVTCERLYGPSNDMSAPRRILEEPPPDIGEERPDLPPELVALCFQLFAKDPNHRPGNAKEVADRLDTIRVAMEAEQGVVSLADHLRAFFSHELDRHKAAIARALKHNAQKTSLSFASKHDDGDGSEEHEARDIRSGGNDSLAASQPKRRAWIWLLTLGAGLIVVLTGSWFGLARQGAEDVTGEESVPGEGGDDLRALISGGSNAHEVLPIATDASATPEDAEVITVAPERREKRPLKRKRPHRSSTGPPQLTKEPPPAKTTSSSSPRYTPWSYED